MKFSLQSVFKAYDHDSDGFISEEEFVSFKDNFPMMESFSAMDVDRYGLFLTLQLPHSSLILGAKCKAHKVSEQQGEVAISCDVMVRCYAYVTPQMPYTFISWCLA